ncbi:hypothetical protein, partial [Streptomyces sp. NPDC014894]|uniref:hypothetical protein n=1 Tax=Streptomyces sp. NPDC014894 TaxID=3364931 RepID=UPI0036F5E15A
MAIAVLGGSARSVEVETRFRSRAGTPPLRLWALMLLVLRWVAVVVGWWVVVRAVSRRVRALWVV